MRDGREDKAGQQDTIIIFNSYTDFQKRNYISEKKKKNNMKLV